MHFFEVFKRRRQLSLDSPGIPQVHAADVGAPVVSS